MSSPQRSRRLALFFSLVPGWGHVYWGHEAVGLALFTAFAVSSFALLNGAFIYVGGGREILVAVSGAAVVAAAGIAWIGIMRLTSPARIRAAEERREKRLFEGTVAYLRGDYRSAKALFESCLKEYPLDVEALFRLGVVCARAGEIRQARAWLRRTAKYDLEQKWRWEVQRELEALRRAGTATRRPEEAEQAREAESTSA